MKRFLWGLSALAVALVASAQVYNYFAPGGALSGNATSQAVELNNSGFIHGNLPQAATSSSPNNTLQGNASGSTGPSQALNPLAASTMMSAVLAVDVVATSNLSLSGAATVDGVVLGNGNFVLAQAQTTTSQNGIWVVNTAGAWSRAANFPAGYVIASGCEIVILVRLGNTESNTHWYIPTTSPITIGTTGFTPTGVISVASATRSGTVVIGGGTGSALELVGSAPTSGDAMSFNSAGATAADTGDANAIKGPPAVEGASTGHLILQNGGLPPSVSAGTLNSHSTDHWGIITGLSGATSDTLTFQSSYTNTPACVASDSAATAVGVSAISATAVTFSMTALTGSLYYLCFGTN